MIFSGHVSIRRCNSCELEINRATPTSIAFLLGLAMAGSATLSSSDILGSRWWVISLLLVANAFMVLTIFGLTDFVKNAVRPLPEECPKCGQKMQKSGGFYDFALFPDPSEIVGAALYAGLVLLIRVVVVTA